MIQEDYCSLFFERWINWSGVLVDIWPCCKVHDVKCSFSAFTKCLWSKHIMFGTGIAVVAQCFCWILHTKLMLKRWRS